MKRSIRFKIALAASILSTFVTVLFATIATWRFYEEQLDLLRHESGSKRETIRDAQEETQELVGTFLLTLPIVIGVSAIAAWWIAGRLSRPLTDLAAAATKMDARTLDQRLPVPTGKDEIADLAEVLNRLLARLEKSFAQASRFAADASHEFRTPLTIMRGEIEEAIAENPSAPGATFLVGLLEETQHLASISEKLLLLARADAGKLIAEFELINLSDLVTTILEDVLILAENRHLQIDSEIIALLLIKGDKALLKQLFFNLFDNAVKYNVSGGWVRAALEATEDMIVFTLSNSGSAIPPERRSRLFERFSRMNDARDRESGGAGLGLSLCREIAWAHQGNLELASSNREANTFRLSIPSMARGCHALWLKMALSMRVRKASQWSPATEEGRRS